ncbi:SIS domain-containing protein [Brevibacillus humidisoli]|uniref:SIS domain-containing protein n=1 Tax=Brevibacillus humidisoli TaxID=2895522 RepID=UPI001E41D80D|nr:SIS domain-containing protein [Brevibacillus humidisoli]UFJ39921.1 SIS domain-containing protein [Brevibacillus humidisoli]
MLTKGLENEQVQKALDAMKERTIDRVFFAACGGSSALMYPSKYLLDREAKTITSDVYNANEFIHRDPATLGENSLVILCSHSGKTPETVQAAAYARQKGALTISLTQGEDSPLAKESECVIRYEKASYFDETIGKNTDFYIMYQLVTGLLYLKEGNNRLSSMLKSLEHLDHVYARAKEIFAERAEQFGERYKDASIIYTMASGSNYCAAYMFGICILMEMQWIHSHPIHAGEYFHGPFEILDEDVPFVILLGLDETRPLEERAANFSKKYGKNLVIIDAKEFDMTGIEEDVKGYIAPLVLNKVLGVYSTALAKARNHPLETRRYMGKVEY